MTISSRAVAGVNARMDSSHPRSDGPHRRRTFTPADKLTHLAAYEPACQTNDGGAYLRREGLCSSLSSEWRKQRDAGVLAGTQAGTKVGKLTAEQAEIARLRRELDRTNKRLATTEVALEIMGKAHALLEQISESADTDEPHKEALTATHRELAAAGVTTRAATTLTSITLSTAARDKARRTESSSSLDAATECREPAKRLTAAEREQVLTTLNGDRFVDQAPLEVYAQLLDEGTYLCSVSTIYRILRENAQVAERRRQARYPARVCPELVAAASRQVYTWVITKLPGPVKGVYYDA